MDKGTKTILIVDDATDNLDVLSGILSPYYIIKATTSGERALEVACSEYQKIDLILLDVMMPKLDGYAVCKQLKQDVKTKSIPVIFVSALNEVTNETAGFQLGAVDYIVKPVVAEIVLARVQTQLALADQNHALEKLVQQRTMELERSRFEIIKRLGRAAEFKDNETGMHVVRMSHYAAVLAKAIGLNEAEAHLLLHASPMHDIGKIGVPDQILLKPSKLNEEEWMTMKKHPKIGCEIIGEDESDLLNMAATVALTHHEKWDGSGYPNGLVAENIPLVGRIVALADVFDALTTVRPYKNAWPVAEATALIKEQSAKHFDPKLVEVFFKVLPEILQIKDRYAENSE